MDRKAQVSALGNELKCVVMISKNGVPLSSLPRDYKTMMGKPIAFRELGFSSLEQLIREVPSLLRITRGYNGDSIVTAVADDATAHIASLISRQKAPKKSSRPSLRARRRPDRPAFLKNRWTGKGGRRTPPVRSNPTWNHPHSDSHTQNRFPLQQQQQQPLPQQVSPPTQNTSNRKYEVPPRFANKTRAQDNRQTQSSQSSSDSNVVRQSSVDNSATNVRKLPKYDFVTNIRQELETTIKPIPLSEPQPVVDNPTTRPVYSFNPVTATRPAIISTMDQIPKANFQFNGMEKSIENFRVTMDGNKRTFNSKAAEFQPRNGEGDGHTPLQTEVNLITPERVISPELELPNTPVTPKTSMDLIALYAAQRDFQAVYKTVSVFEKRTKSSRYLSTLTLLEVNYLSYPDEMPTPEEANELAATRAVALLSITPESVYVRLPVTPHSTTMEQESLINRLESIVFPKTERGIWASNVQHLYEEEHKESLPNDWLTLIQTQSSMKVSSVGGIGEKLRYIIYPPSPSNQANASIGRDSPGNDSCLTMSSDHRSISLDGSTSSGLPDPIQLSDGDWEVVVKFVHNSTQIVVNLIDNINMLSTLSDEMNEFYGKSSSLLKISEVTSGEVYALLSDGSWERVQIISIEKSTVECYFLDHGGYETASIASLCELKRQFLELPFQAISCELAGLEFFSEDTEATALLVDRLLGKSFIARAELDEDMIYITLFDVSTEDDINVNEDFIATSSKAFMTPKLPEVGKLCMATLSHIEDNGDLFVRIDTPRTQIIDSMLNDIQNVLQLKAGSLKSVDPRKVHAVKQADGTWRRALPMDAQVKDNQITVRLLDYGTMHVAQLDDLVEIESFLELGELSVTLTTLPHQTARCRLNNVPMEDSLCWTQKANTRLRELAPIDTPLHLKVITKQDLVPATVELFKRNENQEIVSINLMLASETTLFGSAVEPPSARSLYNCHPRTLPPVLRSTHKPAQLPLSSPNVFIPPLKSANSTPVTTPLFNFENGGLIHQANDLSENVSIPNPTIPEVNHRFDVNIVLATSPDEIIVQSFQEVKALDKLQVSLNQFYQSEENYFEMDPCLLKSGHYFALKHSGDQRWYRAYLEKSNLNESSCITVIMYLIDFGEYQYVGMDQIQPLYKQFKMLPAQAIRCRLAGVAPLGPSWSTDEARFFQILVMDKAFVSVIKSKTYDPSKGAHKEHFLALSLIDTSTDLDVHIDKLLFENKKAQPLSS